jgi:predicted dehydrogenase
MKPEIFYDEKELIKRVKDIDLLVISTPNFMHTPQLLRWAMHPICILVEKPVAISEKQIMALDAAKHDFSANIWVAMEYRYIPAIQKLYQLLPSIGSIKNITIRENRFPFLSKVSEWNKDPQKTGDTLVEKCCHFFDLFRLISGKEMKNCAALILRGLLDHEYGYDKRKDNPTRIIDSAYVLLDLSVPSNESKQNNETIGCLELCMYADGSRHQEEIVVTGTKGRLEAYLPENKVFHFERAKESQWKDRSQPPPRKSIKEEVIDCSDLSIVYSFAKDIPQHSGHHYYSTAVEWKYLIETIENWKKGQKFIPQVTLEDGIAAVKMGITAQTNVWNKAKEEVDTSPNPLIAFSTKSSDQLLNLAIDIAANVSLKPKLSPNFHVDNELIDSHNFNEEEKGP